MCVNIRLGDSLLPGGTKPIAHQFAYVWQLLISDYSRISEGPLS